MKQPLFILIIFFVIACSRVNVDPEQFDYRQGSAALEMTFEENLPTDQVYEGTTVPFSVMLHNDGAEPIQGGIFSLITDDKLVAPAQGLSLDNVLATTDALNKAGFDLEGRSVRTPVGGKAFVTGILQIKSIGAQREEFSTNLNIVACYPYRTIVRRSVCLDTDIYKQVKVDQACEMQDISAGTQGGPLAVSQITVDVSPHSNPRKVEPRFVFEIQNVGEGVVVSSNSYADACSARGSPRFDEVRVVARMPSEQGSQRLICEPSLSDQAKDIGILKLKTSNNEIRCNLFEGIDAGKGSYTAILEIELSYGYVQTLSRELTIKKGT